MINFPSAFVYVRESDCVFSHFLKLTEREEIATSFFDLEERINFFVFSFSPPFLPVWFHPELASNITPQAILYFCFFRFLSLPTPIIVPCMSFRLFLSCLLPPQAYSYFIPLPVSLLFAFLRRCPSLTSKSTFYRF